MYLPAANGAGLTGGAMSTEANPNANLSKRANSLVGSEWLRNSFSIWRGLGKNREERKLAHPAMFTVGLVSKLLETYTHCNENEALLDPFAGVGTALVAAASKQMKSVGLDINKSFRDIFLKRAMPLTPVRKYEYYICDARKMSRFVKPESMDICITSPPYWDILNRKRSADGKKTRPYSHMKDDLGNMKSYEEFINAFGQVADQVCTALKTGKIFIVNVMDIRKQSKFYPLHIDVIAKTEQCGFSLEDIIIWDRQDEYNNMRPLGYPYKFIINKVHEYLLVFRK